MVTLLTFRPSRSGELVAAYLGACRVGYAQRGSRQQGWVWNLSLVRPEGGLYMGREPELEGAQRALEACAGAWVGAALPGWAAPGPQEAQVVRERLVEEGRAALAVASRKKSLPKSKKAVASSEI